MLLGAIADDFTGASDIANTLAKGLPGQGGLRTTQYLDVPRSLAAAEVEAGVISLKSRSIPAKEAIAQSLAALAWLKEQGCRQFVFKYCSTFDSAPDGNIGPVGEALSEALGVWGVVACPAFPSTGRAVFQGHLFVKDMLLSESGMQNHPLNPMTDPNIRRWLTRQTRTPVGLIPWQMVAHGANALRAALAEARAGGERLVIVDAIRDEDLVTIAEASRDAVLITGGSGIAMGLPANFIASGAARGSVPTFSGMDGAEAVLVGSCSPTTLQQVEVHASKHPTLRIQVDRLIEGTDEAQCLVTFIEKNRGAAPLVYSSAPPERLRSLQARYGAACLAVRLERLFAETALRLVRRGLRRLVVAGGETSGAVVGALGISALTVGPEIDPGVPILFTREPIPLALALKSGNFGSPCFFAKALEQLRG
jgi:uncharacterized protein YgbK (DUF1537 family)